MTRRPTPLVGRILLAATGLAITAAALLPFALVDDRPEPLATRWSFDGEVTSSMSSTSLFVMVAVFVLPTSAALVALALARRPARPGLRPMVAGIAAMLGAIFAWASISTLVANRSVTDWRDAPGPGLWQIAALIGVSLALGALAAWAASNLPEAPLPVVEPGDLDVSEASVVAWTRELTVRGLVAVAAVTVGAGEVVVAVTRQWWVGLVLLLCAVPCVALSRIEVVADRRGLTVAYGPWGWPRTQIPIERLAAASPVEIRPSEWGGWGYRGSIRLFRTAAVVLRAGPGLRVDLTDGRRFAVTIDDPETAAAVLERERRRETPA